MITIDISKASEQLDSLIDDVNTNNISLTIINDKGKNAVLISEEKWNEINETLSILYIDKNEDWGLAQTFDSNERW